MVLEKEFTYNGLNYKAFSNGKILGMSRGKFLKTRINEDGYEEVTLGQAKHRNARVKVHRVIAYLFVPNDDPENKTEVNHKDFNRANNDYRNLEWVSHEDNIKYSAKYGHYDNGSHIGEKNGRSRLTKDDVREIRKMLDEKNSVSKIAKTFNVGWTTIQHIKLGDTWKGVC